MVYQATPTLGPPIRGSAAAISCPQRRHEMRQQHYRRRHRFTLGMLAAASLAAVVMAPSGGAAADPHFFPPEPFECDVPRETRAAISLRALELLRGEGFEHVETGVYASHVPKDGDTVAGNPNTLYGFVGFNDSAFQLVPPDYPPFEWPPANPNGISPPKPKALPGLIGVAYQRREAVAFLMCTPPPARYFGMTAYVSARILFNATERGQGDSTPLVHMPVAEVKNPLNYLVVNTTKSVATEARRQDPSSFFQSLALFVFAPNRAVFEAVRDAYIEAGLSPQAANYYPISGQTVRLHERGKPFDYDYPDLVTHLCRVSYFENVTAGYAWGQHPWPAFFLRAPAIPAYESTVPEPRMLSDISGDSEAGLWPTMERLLDAIVENRTSGGRAHLLRREQIVAVPNDRFTRDQCLNNASFCAAVDPIMTSGCGFGTTDCRYGTSAALDQPFGRDRFFVVVGVQHERLGHSSYSSVMLTSATGYEERAHTTTLREQQGAAAPPLYLSSDDNPDLNKLYAVTLARACPDDDAFCLPFTEAQFAPDEIVYWMERAYLQRATGVAPNIDEYVMSVVLTFEGEPW